MPDKYLYVMDPIHDINPKKDTTFALMVESQKRGVNNYCCQIRDLKWSNGKTSVDCQQVQVFLPGQHQTHAELESKTTLDLNDFKVVWMRKDPPVDQDFIVATMLLDFHDPETTLVMNRPQSLRLCNEKLWGLFAAELMPPTIVSSNAEFIQEKFREFGKAVLKPILGAGGAGILIFEHDDRNLASAIDLLTLGGKQAITVQKFIPRAREGDKRVLLLGGEAIGAVLRVPHNSDHRANIHVGGAVQKAAIDQDDRRIAAALKTQLLNLGLHFVGLDIIAGQLTEINITSPTGAQEIDVLDERTAQTQVAAQVMDYIEHIFYCKTR